MENKLKIIHLVGGNKNSGAFKGADLLNKDLKRNYIDSNILYEEEESFTKKIKAKFRQTFEKFPKILYPKRISASFSSSIIGHNFFNNQKYKNSDIVHLHWINNGFFNISSIPKIKKPVVWTIRDMWPFTGGCHYTLGCNKFTSNCQSCPQLKSNFKYDLSTFNQNRKLKYFNKNISFVVNSNWMRKMAEKSTVLRNFEILTFYPSFDIDNFFEDKSENNETINLNPNKKIILYGAQNIEAEYKGFKYFLDSIDYLDKSKFQIVFFGNFWKQEKIKNKRIEYTNLGFINDIKIQRKLYSIADVFVATSLQEGFPKTVAESLLCNTPVVYFKDTAIEDICESKIIGGYGANYKDSKDIAKGINWVLENEQFSKNIAIEAEKKIKKNFNSKKLIQKYINLYQEILNKD
ncbi:glycosyltransferase [Candidatus Pelagibacter communis]|uniref:glycosyltransferase n=1 Tax=Pelagibacter ubique TaxID=198252 RepID=UPI00094C009B|nr:glycosyltransferase [Candidatus Pelagibacter ubique]